MQSPSAFLHSYLFHLKYSPKRSGIHDSSAKPPHMPFIELFFVGSYHYALRRLFDLADEEYHLEDVQRQGEEAVRAKMRQYEEVIQNEMEKEKERVERAFRASHEWKGTEGKNEGKVALVRACTNDKERERTMVKGKERGNEGPRGRARQGAHTTSANISAQGISNSLLASLSSWFCEPKKKTE